MSASRSPSPDLTGVRPVYAAPLHRGVWWVFAVIFAANLVAAALRVAAGVDGWALVWLTVHLLLLLTLLVVPLRLPAAVFVRRDGLRFRRNGRSGPLIPWHAIAEIRVQGRWDDVSTLVLRDGRTMPLVAMPVEDAERLADALIDASY